MSNPTRDQLNKETDERRARFREFLQRTPPVPLKQIMAMEGMHERATRILAKEIEAELGLDYFASGGAAGTAGEHPFGLSEKTHRLRQRLADALYDLRCPRGATQLPRASVARLVGLNQRQQIRAETKPFMHDWTLSQIERLAEARGVDPMELIRG